MVKMFKEVGDGCGNGQGIGEVCENRQGSGELKKKEEKRRESETGSP